MGCAVGRIFKYIRLTGKVNQMHNYIFMIAVLALLGLSILVVTFCNYTLSNEQYDRLKSYVSKWPYLMTFLGVLVATFHFSNGEETITVVAAIGALLSHILGVSHKNYTDGAIAEEADWVEDGEWDGDVDE